ncbi:MAG: hypothetical protein IPH05_17360 [Flavobacteriales bacterium]|nr:hypothetical protein [Flavobacteriales bacterium]
MGLRSPAPACTVCCPAPIPLGPLPANRWELVQVANSGSYTNYADHRGQLQHDRLEFQHDGNAAEGSDAGGSVSVNLNIVNDGGSTFVGEYDVSLYNLDGSFAQTIGTIPNPMDFRPATPTSRLPHLWSGHGNGATGHVLGGRLGTIPGAAGEAHRHRQPNVTEVTVVAPATQPDSYEVNNSVAQAYALPVNFREYRSVSTRAPICM